ncbi:class F sortase [Pseudarthrobacter sp. PvP090]|uniref:class F sortase n=1 Tax=Pseudarthrobacter sp. PvP090 TaxID=3156393 RepID=UPI0033958F07
MKRTTAAEATGRPPASVPRTAAQGFAPRIAAVAVTVALLITGCTAPQETAAPQPVATGSTVAKTAAPGTPQPPPPAQATTDPVPEISIPVWPATPMAQTPKDPAPRFLTADGTTINMPIVEVGVSPDGAMEIPEPFNEAGWYRFGPAPGAAAGTAVIAAHVDTTSDSAPFSQLKALAPGTLVTVQREGAAPVTFRVTGVELMAKDAFDGASVFRRDGPPELKLVTCGGRWLDEEQDYGDNVIVTAVPA